jgi:hypothetical protein
MSHTAQEKQKIVLEHRPDATVFHFTALATTTVMLCGYL